MKCFATTRHSNTDPKVAIVANILSIVPSTAERTGDEDCAGNDGLLLFDFCFFTDTADLCWIRSIGPDSDAPVGLFRSLNSPSHAAAVNCLKQTVN